MISWCEPMVRDRLAGVWRETGSAEDARRFAELHWRMWRGALSGLSNLSVVSRRELMREIVDKRVPHAMISLADAAVVDEIAEVVLSRFRRSPQLAKGYMMVLVHAAAQLMAGPAQETRAQAA
jgi:hypothetical protein